MASAQVASHCKSIYNIFSPAPQLSDWLNITCPHSLLASIDDLPFNTARWSGHQTGGSSRSSPHLVTRRHLSSYIQRPIAQYLIKSRCRPLAALSLTLSATLSNNLCLVNSVSCGSQRDLFVSILGLYSYTGFLKP